MAYYKQGHVWPLLPHHLPTEVPSLTDFPHQNETIHKSAETQTLRQGGFEYSVFPLPTSQDSNSLIHQISQAETKNLFCSVQHIGTATSWYYCLSRTSLVTSPSLKFTTRAEANNPGMQVIVYLWIYLVYLWIYLVTYQSIPKAFRQNFTKSNSNWHSSHISFHFLFL